uniref:Uncharacterized protein n=1 Tax=Amphimedon queenslandica TaxID=400682 RepID=A0A1X7UMQ5_AMPQE
MTRESLRLREARRSIRKCKTIYSVKIKRHSLGGLIRTSTL